MGITLGTEPQDNDIAVCEGGKRPYSAPELVQWGTILDLTGGPINGTVDGFFSGTTGT